MYLLDTNVVSELRKARPHGAVTAWIKSVADRDLFISAVTLGEIQAGIEIAFEQDPMKATEIETWLDQVAATWNVLPMDGATFRAWGKLMHRRSDTLIEDAMIAATALVHDLQVVTRDVKHFKELGVRLKNPFTPA
jgi:toxin FitB